MEIRTLLPFLTSRKARPGLTGIDLQPDGVCLAQVERGPGGAPLLRAAEFRPWAVGESQHKVLEKLARDYSLDRCRCTTVLPDGEYSLLLTEAPDVPGEELRAALRWRVKDLIDFHINDATLDVFEVPGEKPAGRLRPMYVVAAKSSAIQRRVDLLDAAGIGLEIIDIPELVQRNLAALLAEDVNGVACLALGADSGLVTITRQGEIYLARNVGIGLRTLEQAEDTGAYFERIALEIQRSLDYYDSHFRQAQVAGIVLLPMVHDVAGLTEHLQANLGTQVTVMNVADYVSGEGTGDAGLIARCLPAIGAALRQEEAAL